MYLLTALGWTISTLLLWCGIFVFISMKELCTFQIFSFLMINRLVLPFQKPSMKKSSWAQPQAFCAPRLPVLCPCKGPLPAAVATVIELKVKKAESSRAVWAHTHALLRCVSGFASAQRWLTAWGCQLLAFKHALGIQHLWLVWFSPEGKGLKAARANGGIVNLRRKTRFLMISVKLLKSEWKELEVRAWAWHRPGTLEAALGFHSSCLCLAEQEGANALYSPVLWPPFTSSVASQCWSSEWSGFYLHSQNLAFLSCRIDCFLCVT